MRYNVGNVASNSFCIVYIPVS